MSSKLHADAEAPVAPWRGGVLEVAGPDSGAFLQAQLMNDVRTLADRQWQWTGWLTPKGRVQALAALLRLDAQRFWLVLPDVKAAALTEGLRRFLFRSKVNLAARDDVVLRGYAASPAALGSGASGARADGAGDAWVIDLGGDTPRTLQLGGDAPTAALELAGPDAFAMADLAHGLPRLEPQVESPYTPQMLGLDRLAAYSVKKGCYPGQEIVARTHFLGQAKRGLARLQGERPLVSGERLRAAGGEHEVLCAARDADRHEALAVLPREAHAGRWETADGAAVHVIPFAEGLAR